MAEFLSYRVFSQKTCLHDAKVRMAGYKNLYECIQCHKFIPNIESKDIDHKAPQYLENGWEDE